MIENLAQLVARVLPLFMRFGIKSLTMDDIARELKVSKKTLYEFVTDKKDLVTKVMRFSCEHEEKCSFEIINRFENAIDELLEITKHVSNILRQMHPSIHYDLEKYYPEAWEEFQKMKVDHVFKMIVKNLQTGVEQGLFRDDINIPIIAKIYIARMDIVFDDRVFPADEFKFEVYQELMKYHILGLATDKGRHYLSKKLTEVQ